MSIFKTDTTAKLTAEVDRLEKRKAALAGKLDAARNAETAARAAHKRYFVDGDESDIATAARLAAAVTAATSDVAALGDALSTVNELIAEGKQAVTAAKESAERGQRAAEIAKKIERLEPLAATAERQFEALAQTLEKIANEADDPALDVRQYVELKGHTDRLPVTSIIGAALAQAIFRDMPDLLTVEKSFGAAFARVFLPMMIERYDGLSRDIPIDHGEENSFTPKPLSGALDSNLINPLRTAAAEILSGSRPLATARPIADDDESEDGEPAFERRRIVLTKSIRWIDWSGEPRQHPDGDADIASPVAMAAKAAGVGFDHGSREGDYHLDRRIERGFNNSSQPMSKDVVDLRVTWPSTERAAA